MSKEEEDFNTIKQSKIKEYQLLIDRLENRKCGCYICQIDISGYKKLVDLWKSAKFEDFKVIWTEGVA